MTPKKAVVTWEDCKALDTELWAEKVKDGAFVWVPYIVETVGFLLYDGPEGVVVTDSWTDADHTGQRTQIPRGMIRSMVIEPERRRRKKD